MRMPTQHPDALNDGQEQQLSRGRFVVLARVAWLLLVGLTLLVFLASIPAYLTQLQTVCNGTDCQPLQMNHAGVQLLHQLGISPAQYAAVNLAFDLVWALAWFALGAFIAWRKSTDWWMLLVSLSMIVQGTATVTLIAEQGGSLWQYPALIANTFAFVLVSLVFLLFPDGRFTPGWTPWVFGGVLVSAVLYLRWPDNALLQTLFDFSELPCLIAVPIYRYWRIASPLQRQQTKWVLYSITFVSLADVVDVIVLPAIVGTGPSPESGFVYSFVAGSLVTVFTFFIPIAFAIALLRYRLWDIDTLINRTLVYGLLTGILAALYFGLLISLESLAGLVNKQASQPIVLVVSTLAIFVLVQPLRNRLQRVIDRRFYRRKYDAEKILAAFSETLRNEVDLSHLREQVLTVVQETMQPAQVSLWLRLPEGHSEEALYRLEASGQVPAIPDPS